MLKLKVSLDCYVLIRKLGVCPTALCIVPLLLVLLNSCSFLGIHASILSFAYYCDTSERRNFVILSILTCIA